MRNLAIFIGCFGILFNVDVRAELAAADSSADQFVEALLKSHAKISSCRDEFDPHDALIEYSNDKGIMQIREEPDRREPGVTNHVITWTFPGLNLTSFTYFTFYGPSTWLDRMEISRPSALTKNLSIGDPVTKFSKVLGLPEEQIRSGRLITDSADVTFASNDEDAITSITLVCVAD